MASLVNKMENVNKFHQKIYFDALGEFGHYAQEIKMVCKVRKFILLVTHFAV
jgi:hypothetical protein